MKETLFGFMFLLTSFSQAQFITQTPNLNDPFGRYNVPVDLGRNRYNIVQCVTGDVESNNLGEIKYLIRINSTSKEASVRVVAALVSQVNTFRNVTLASDSKHKWFSELCSHYASKEIHGIFVSVDFDFSLDKARSLFALSSLEFSDTAEGRAALKAVLDYLSEHYKGVGQGSGVSVRGEIEGVNLLSLVLNSKGGLFEQMLEIANVYREHKDTKMSFGKIVEFSPIQDVPRH